jgi:hypothetical protein
MTNKDLCSDVWAIRRDSRDTLGNEQWVMQDTINHLQPKPGFGPEAYTDDNHGASIEEIVVRDRIPYPTHSQSDDGAPIANNAARPMPHSTASPFASHAPPSAPDHTARPMPGSTGSPFASHTRPSAPDRTARRMPDSTASPYANYAPPSMPYYYTPPMPDFSGSPFANYAPPPMQGFNGWPFANYAPPSVPYYNTPAMPGFNGSPFVNYAPPTVPYYPVPPPMAPYGTFRRRTSPPEFCDNHDQRQGFWERLFLKP